MLKRRLIPKLQLKARKIDNTIRPVLVTTKRFDSYIDIGNPITQARIYEAQVADELIFLNIDRETTDWNPIIEIVKSAAEEIFMPFCVGGGIRNLDDIEMLLKNGADKISINTVAIEDPSFITMAAKKFGSQCIVVSIDYKITASGQKTVWSKGGIKDTGFSPLDFAIECEARGAGEILLTSIDRDGTRSGLDLEVTRSVVDNLSIPVITSGGCGLAEHFVAGFTEGRADGVSSGTYFCFKDENPMQTRARIANTGVPIRIKT